MNVQRLGELTKRELVNLGYTFADCVKGLLVTKSRVPVGFMGVLDQLRVLDMLAAKIKYLGRRK